MPIIRVGGIFDEWPCPSGAGLNQVYQRLVAVNALDKLSAEQTRCRVVIPREARVNYTHDCRAI